MFQKFYRIADFDFCINCSFESVFFDVQWMPENYTPFEISSEEAATIYSVDIVENLEAADADSLIAVFNEKENPQKIYQIPNNGGHLFEQYDHKGNICCRMAMNERRTSFKLALLGANLSNKVLGLNNAMMIAYMFATIDKDTLLIHSSVVSLNKRGYMFLGKSGTGKSTHSRLWLEHIKGTSLLNDDNPIIRIVDGKKAMVYGSPWSGKTPCYKQEKAWGGAFVMLEQKPYNRIEKQETFKAFVSILSSSSSITWDNYLHDSMCSTISKLLALTPIYKLECLPNVQAAKLSYNVIHR